MPVAQQFIDDTASEEGIKALVDLRPWMKHKRMEIIDSIPALDKFIDEACEAKRCSVDLETDGLNTGPHERGKGARVAQPAGFCLSYHRDYGVYIPVGHKEGRNLPLPAVVSRIKRLVSECTTIYHNFKFDGELLRNMGVIIEDPKKYEDTLLMAAVLMADRKTKGLKPLVKDLLGKKMIELSEIVPNKANMDFTALHPKDAVYYAAPDGFCTLELWEYLSNIMLEWDPNKSNGTHFIYDVEKGCQLAVMEMERNLVKVDVPYYRALATKVEGRLDKIEDEIFEAAGQVFDINSNKQLGEILFDKLKITYPLKDKSLAGEYFVKDEVLEIIKGKHPLPALIQEYREIGKIYNTYLLHLINNADTNSCVKFQLNQTAADSGRFSSRGGSGLLFDGYSGVNCQNIPAAKKEDPWKLRKGIVARPGFKIVAIDYSGEELRIATNFSKEKTWINEFNFGSGDLHSITGSLLFGGTPEEMAENKTLRGIAKSVNFLILYGGGASKLAANAKIPLAEAQERLERFFDALPQLSDWLKTERIRARRRGYSVTAFGRRRPLAEMYNSGDRGLISKADRLAVNAAIQGTGADIIKIALYRVWSYIRKNNLQNDVRMLMPIHDEIVYEVRETMLDQVIPAISEIMKLKDLSTALKWSVHLEVDAEYGDNFMVQNNYFKDLKEGITAAIKRGTKMDEAIDALEVLTKINKSANSQEEYNAGVINSGVDEKKAEEKTPQTSEIIVDSPHPKNEDLMTSEKTENPESPVGDPVGKGPSEFFSYEVSKSDALAKAHAEAIWAVLDGIDKMCDTSKKKRIRLTKDKRVLYTTSKRYSVEAFLALAFNYTI